MAAARRSTPLPKDPLRDREDDDGDGDEEESEDGLNTEDEPRTEDEEEDDDDNDDALSHYSSVSEDSLPPIHHGGHTYHGSGRLYFPNDDSEARRLALQHELFKICLNGGLCDSRLPIDPSTTPPGASSDATAPRFSILDVGSGSGLWACEMAQRYPQVDILGIDLSSVLLPKDVPPNLTFEIADATEDWPPTLYDFIHIRHITGGGIRDWEAFLAEAYAHLKPGGYLEFTEMRPRFHDVEPNEAALSEGEKAVVGVACLEYQRISAACCMRLEIDFDPLPRISGILRGLGAEGVRERTDWLPQQKHWGSDPVMRKKGQILAEVLEFGLENWGLRLFGKCGWGVEEHQALVARVVEELRDPKTRSCANLTFITARKSSDEE